MNHMAHPEPFLDEHHITTNGCISIYHLYYNQYSVYQNDAHLSDIDETDAQMLSYFLNALTYEFDGSGLPEPLQDFYNALKTLLDTE